MRATRVEVDPSAGGVVDPRFAYIIGDDQMAQGSTLGAPRCCIVMKPTGEIAKVYSPDAGCDYFGAIGVHHWDRRSGIRLDSHSGEFHIHPERQDHVYELYNGVHAHEQVFPYNDRGDDGRPVPPPAVYYRIHLTNTSKAPVAFDTYALCELRGNTAHDIVSEYDETLSGIVTWNRDVASQLRLFGAMGGVSSWETSDDRGKFFSRTAPGALSNTTRGFGADPIGALHVAVDLAPGESRWIDFMCVLSASSRDDLASARSSCPPGNEARLRTSAYYWHYLTRSVVRTPDNDVNRGVLWAKANILRVQTYAPTGWCFTNDPTRSNNSVGRDTAWMTFGADYLNADFAREALAAYFRLQEVDGKIVEYYDVRNDRWDDYNLNVNDNTPLAVIALWHHYNVTRDEAFVRRCYDGAKRAMDYMLSQRDERGLVWCTSTGTADWGIVGWRNVIQGYRLSGASTEVNSECYAALEALAEMAHLIGDDALSQAYRTHAQDLSSAINTHLVNPENDLYYLNIDIDGLPRSDITADLVFPILFGVAPPSRAARIIGALSDATFWTEAGIRTVPRGDLSYGPTNGYGLLGGVWVAVTFWYAFAAAKYNPSFMAKALSESFRHFSSDPGRNNTVPGQFSEWLHGETLTNQGMMLSPWDAPRYLWAAIEGAAGLDPSKHEATIAPALADDWRWLTAVDVPFQGNWIAWIAMRMPGERVLMTTSQLSSPLRVERFDRDVTEQISIADPLATVVAFENGAKTVAFVGNSSGQAVTTAAAFSSLPAEAYAMRMFSTVWNDWQDCGTVKAAKLHDGVAVMIDAGGFALVEIRPAPKSTET